MIAAIYARKSTEQNGVADEAKSVTRQIEHARAYASRKGWNVADEHVYSDDGVSGAEFIKRPGFVQLMEALKPRSPFQVLVMLDESRLGRGQIETAWALKQITDAGVRVFFYLEDWEWRSDRRHVASPEEWQEARQRFEEVLRDAARLVGERLRLYRPSEFEFTTCQEGVPRDGDRSVRIRLCHEGAHGFTLVFDRVEYVRNESFDPAHPNDVFEPEIVEHMTPRVKWVRQVVTSSEDLARTVKGWRFWLLGE